jgi:hypothetical protein
VNLVEGTAGRWENYQQDLEQLKGHKRVWLLFAHNEPVKDIDEEKVFLLFLDKRGTRLDCFRSEGAVLYLYNLDEPD